MNSLEANAVTKTFPTRGEPLVVLRQVSLTLDEGERLAILGPSGSGKSTLLHVLGTLDRPTTGEVRLDGQNPFALAEPELARFRNQQVGFVFQDHHLLPQCSVLENVLLPTMAQAASASKDVDRACELIEHVGLTDRIEHRPAELSGGQRQRVAVARALVNHPRLVLADEPTGNLDRQNADLVGQLLIDLVQQQQAMLILVTHSRRLAQRFDRQLTLEDGMLGPWSSADRTT